MIKTKFLFPLIYLLLVFFLNACTLSSTIEEGFDAFTQSFSEADEFDEPLIEADSNAIMQSTRKILASHSESKSAVNPEPTALSDTVPVEIKFDNVWQRIPSLFQLSDINNKHIETQLKWYIKHKQYFEHISKRARPFLHLITEEVEKRKMPGEIALLPIVESAFKTDAYSRQKASGLWQFVPATGRYFGLKQTWWYDGRRDVYMATDAALTYLTQLNKYYQGDWLLALAAYNAGAGNVDKAIKKNRKKGKATDYWSLDLPKETRRYIPKLLAISRLIQSPQQYQLKLYPIHNTAYLQLVNIKSQIDLAVLAKLSSMTVKEIKSYNPAFKQWSTDPDGPHHILLPIDKVENFENKLALITDKERLQRFRHKIRAGESLSVIAQRYKISTKVLKQTNHLKSNRIRAGKYLLVPSPDNHMAANNFQASSTQTSNRNSATGNVTKNIHYTVRKGDSFWAIARHFNLSHKKLAAMNGLSSGDTLSIGQILNIRSSAQAAKKTLQKQITNNQTQLITYQVKKGDSLYLISRQFNVSINELKTWNNLMNKQFLQPGQRLRVYLQTI